MVQEDTRQSSLRPIPALLMLERAHGCTSLKEARERLKRAVNRMDTSQGDGWAQQTEEVSLGKGPGLSQILEAAKKQVLLKTSLRVGPRPPGDQRK